MTHQLSWILAGLFVALAGAPAEACLSCGCAGSSATGDLSPTGSVASLFAQDQHWLVQRSIGYRSVTGSFNERGGWYPVPVGGTLQTVQGTLGLMYFPTQSASLGLQLPLLANSLTAATWGPGGSVMPTDSTVTSDGFGLGDIGFNGSYKLLEADQWAIAAWGGASLPTGRAQGLMPSALTGTGVVSGNGGLMGVSQWQGFELLGSFGYQQAFGAPPVESGIYYVSDAWLGQLRLSYAVSPAWRLGMGTTGYLGNWHYSANTSVLNTAKWRLSPSVQYAVSDQQGFNLVLGYDPSALGTNSLTDTTVSLVFYEFMK